MFKILNDLELYVTLTAVGESRTLLEAARKLGVSQATVSLRLKRLQSQHGYLLFEYQGKRLVITPRGQELLSLVSKVFEDLPSQLQRFHLEKDLEVFQPIRVGARLEVYDKIVPHLKIKAPLDLRLMNSLEVNRGLVDLTIDAAITHQRPMSTQFISVPLYEDEFMLCCHKSLLSDVGGKLPEYDKRSIEQFISKIPVLSYGHESRLINDWLSTYGVAKEKIFTSAICENWNTLKSFLVNGVGFGVFPKSFVQGVPKSVLMQPVPHSSLSPLRFYLIYRAAYKGNRGIIELKNALKSVFPS
jgi:DNA-binding transcriptional LysR family regulator